VSALGSLQAWLLSDRVLRSSGRGAGVANWLWPDGLYDGLYPEIGGYYLQFLTAVDARDAASRVIAWLDESGPDGDPLTLYHRDMSQSDWRNHCLFAFDLGMILRGFASAAWRWPGIVPGAVMARYLASMNSLIAAGRLRSHRLRAGASEHEVPVKWSTRVDVHHVKIAAALASVGAQFAPVVSATLQDQAEALEREGHGRLRELHPFLYLIEGWLTLWGQTGSPVYLDHAHTAFGIVLNEIGPADRVLPPIVGRNELAVRSDVLAQALRAGIVLEHADRFDAARASQWSGARSLLESALLSRMTPEGGIEFDVIGRHRNVWASLFGWQALSFLHQADTGRLKSREAAASLI
jgi:hypothetical protein